MNRTEVIPPEDRKLDYWTMVSVNTLVSLED
jgi:hypothetical protein